MPFPIPASEFAQFQAFLEANPSLLDAQAILAQWRRLSEHYLDDVTSPEISHRIAAALGAGQPFSVVRIGDGEGNLLTYGEWPETPVLNWHAAKEIVDKQQDQVEVTEQSLPGLKRDMAAAIASSDILGVLDAWTAPPEPLDLAMALAFFERNPRGISGKYRVIHHLLQAAERRELAGKLTGPAHLYINLLAHPAPLFEAAKTVLCLSDQAAAVAKFQSRFPASDIRHIPVGLGQGAPLPQRPDFIEQTLAPLGEDLSGTLCLIGAGPWAELYCHRLKQRGAVAVDFGSGFDVIAGGTTRPAHKLMRQRFDLSGW